MVMALDREILYQLLRCGEVCFCNNAICRQHLSSEMDDVVNIGYHFQFKKFL